MKRIDPKKALDMLNNNSLEDLRRYLEDRVTIDKELSAELNKAKHEKRLKKLEDNENWQSFCNVYEAGMGRQKLAYAAQKAEEENYISKNPDLPRHEAVAKATQEPSYQLLTQYQARLFLQGIKKHIEMEDDYYRWLDTQN